MRNSLRIIGGEWRGRKITFPPCKELRPTPDRVRETVFNWLAPFLAGANCLDLFSGSGALGFEAVSRGANHVVMIDHSWKVIHQLEANAKLLHTNKVTCWHATLPEATPAFTQHFNIVFLDPPYHKNLVNPCCQWLENHALLAPDALIYIEAEASLHPLPLPTHWKILKSKKTGQVGYHLAQVSSS